MMRSFLKAGFSMAPKVCFGILDRVFPLAAGGLREVPPGCFECPEKVLCLKNALATPEGLDLRTGLIDRTPSKGFFGRVKRWSQKKYLHHLKEPTKDKR